MSGGLLHVQHEGEVVARLVQDALRLELPTPDGAHADVDIACVVHPPPVAAVVVAVAVVAAVVAVGGVVFVMVGVAGAGGGAW